MIELTVQRRSTEGTATIGSLFRGTTFECYTLEDVVREVPGQPVDMWKIPGQTAIPVGRYRIGLVNSPKFGPDTLAVFGVPGFDLIRIHAGNTDRDTEGCLLVGQAVGQAEGGTPTIGGSRAALAALKAKIIDAIRVRQDAVWLTIRNPESTT